MSKGRIATTVFMLALFCAACILALDLPKQAAFMPLLVGVPGAILCLWQLVLDLVRAPSPASETQEESEDKRRSEVEIFLWLGAFSVAIIGFGFVVGGPVVVLAFVKFSSSESWKNALFAGAGTFAVIYGVFIWLLELPLFQGLILEMLF